jgi:hypothetical protein
MSTKIQALLWELWRANWWRLLLTFCGMLVLPVTITLSISRPRDLWWRSLGTLFSPLELVPMPWSGQMAAIMVNTFICVLGVGYGVGYSGRNYTLPLTARQLTSVRLASGAFASAALYLLVAVFLNSIFLSGWPYLGPALSYAITFVVAYTIVSYFHARENLRVFAAMLFSPIVGFWIAGHYPTSCDFGLLFHWSEPSILEFALVVLIGIATWGFAEDSVALDRKGRGWAHPLVRRTEPATGVTVRSQNTRRFRSAFEALFWQEWKRDGWLWPLAIACFYGIASIMFLIDVFRMQRGLPAMNMESFIGANVGCMGFTAVFPWCIGVFLSPGRKTQTERCLSTSISTLPVSDATLAWITIAGSMCRVVMCWICVISLSTAWFLVYYLSGSEIEWPNVNSGRPDIFATSVTIPMILTLVFMAWYTTGVGTATGLSGRRWIAFTPIASIPIIFLLFGVFVPLIGFVFGRTAAEILIWILATGVLLPLPTGMICAYAKAWNRRIIGIKSLLLGVIILAAIEAFFLTSHFASVTSRELPFFWHLAIFLAWAAAPPAVVPLAVHFNRHR